MINMIKKTSLLVIFTIAWMITMVVVDAEESSEMRIEQAKIYMPDIKVYYYSKGGSSLEDITATLDNTKLTVESQYSCAQDETGSDYYILVDVSLSIGKGYFANIRQAILEFKNGMKNNDTLTVITFGDQVSVVVDRAQLNDDIQGIIEGLDNADYNTHLFEALDKAAELADEEKYATRRAAAIVITDGEDCSTNESTKNEAMEELQKAGIPLYAMAVRETANGSENAFIGDLSDFSRAANGRLTVFGQDEAVNCILQIQSMLDSAQVLELKASSNRINPVMQSLAVMISGEGSEAIQVCPRYSRKDTEKPTVEVKQTSEKEISVVFSEPVLNAEQSSGYKVTLNGAVLPIYTLNYDKETFTAVLGFSEKLQDGEYAIEFRDITDDTMEENRPEGPAYFVIEKETEQSESVAETETEEIKPSKGISGIYLIVGGGATVLLLLIVLLIIRRKKSGERQNEKVNLTDNVLHLEIHSDEGEKTMNVPIEKTVVVGRSANCDISLVDRLLSRQHFNIEKDNGSFYIMDLGTTNGTMVNGVKISSRCKLKNGDVIQAGALHITITW